jgi:hypothetical protein
MSMKQELLLLSIALLCAAPRGASAQAAPLPQQPFPQPGVPQQQFPQQQFPQPGVPQQQFPQQQFPQQQFPQQQFAAPTSNKRSGSEITVLYSTAAVYGVGMGVWFGAEAKIKDPGLFLIAPAILGVAAPIGVRVRGGDVLEVGFEGQGEPYEAVTLTGPADFVFEGTIEV